MPIKLLQPLHVGNAIRIFYSAPALARAWKILRKTADTFTGHNDPDASVVAASGMGDVQLDVTALTNGTPYFYKPYWWDGTAWTAEAAVSATPAANFYEQSVDPLIFVRDRIELGLKAQLAASKIQTSVTEIAVLTAPPTFDDTAWPVVTIHLNQDASATRGIGEQIAVDSFDELTGEWSSSEGWLSRVQLSIVAWSLNPDERVSLRRALRVVIQANLDVFYDVGFTDIEFQQSDSEDFTSYNVPVYQVMCTFSCQAPAVVGHTDDSVMNSFNVSATV